AGAHRRGAGRPHANAEGGLAIHRPGHRSRSGGPAVRRHPGLADAIEELGRPGAGAGARGRHPRPLRHQGHHHPRPSPVPRPRPPRREPASTGVAQRATAARTSYAAVSLPITHFTLLRWYLRLLIWFRFLWQVSRLNLHLVPTHPDRAAGLAFLGKSTYAFG